MMTVVNNKSSDIDRIQFKKYKILLFLIKQRVKELAH